MTPRYFKDITEGWLEYNRYSEGIPRFLKWSLYSITAAILERKVWAKLPRHTIYPNMYIMLTGPSGVRKSTTSGYAMELLRAVGGVSVMAEILTSQAMLKDMSAISQEKSIKYRGQEYKTASMFLYNGEAATLFKGNSEQNDVKTFLTEFYQCKPSELSNECAYKKSLAGLAEPIELPNICLNVLMCSTLDWFLGSLKEEEMFGGFAARFLFVVERNMDNIQLVKIAERPPSTEHLKEKLVHDLQQIQDLVGPFKMTQEFEMAYDIYRMENLAFLKKNRTPELTGYYARRDEYVMKIAMVLCVLESSEMILEARHWHKAAEEIKDIEDGMFYVYKPVPKSPNRHSIAEVWNYIRYRRGNTKKSELYQRFYGVYSIRQINENITMLKQMGFVRSELLEKMTYYLPIQDKVEVEL